MSRETVVVAILSHRDPPLIRRLVDRVLEGDNTVALVHHDPRGESPRLRPHNRLLMVSDPRPADWGRLSLAQAMMRCLEFAHQTVPELGWLLLVSGQDYPTMPMEALEKKLYDSDADAMLRHFVVDARPDNDVHPWQAVCRRRYLRSVRLPGTRRSLPFPRRHPFTGDTRLFVGDMWANLGYRAVQHLVNQRERLSQVESYLGWCSVPDEALLPTLLLNDSRDLKIRDARHRFIKWGEGGPHPAMLTPADVPAIMASDAFFARKVDSRLSPGVLQALDEAAARYCGQ